MAAGGAVGVFVSPTKKVSAASLLGSQFIGFTAVALFGRLADLTRPYLVARRVGLSLSSQIAVYTIERMFDLGAAAIIFSSALAFTPKSLPHHEVFVRAAGVEHGADAGDCCVCWGGAGGWRRGGGVCAGYGWAAFEGRGGEHCDEDRRVSRWVECISSEKDFGGGDVLLSLAMWGMIGGAYLQTAHAFMNTPELAALSFSRTMLLMAASIGGSLLQLPIIGWFTQIAVTAAAMHTFYGAPIEAATACGAVLLLVTLLCMIPPGLIYSRVEHVSLKKVAQESEAAGAAEIRCGGSADSAFDADPDRTGFTARGAVTCDLCTFFWIRCLLWRSPWSERGLVVRC